MTTSHSTAHANSVHLIGRLASAPEARSMPSGDAAVVWRVVVDRARGSAGRSGAGNRVDTLACIAWAAGARRAALRWQVGNVVEVDGALRRRFWRSPTGPTSRYEIEVHKGRRVSVASR